MAKAPAPPHWYFSLRSPYSYFAYRDLLERYPDVAERLEWIPCWEPDEQSRKLLDEAKAGQHAVPMSRAKHFYILQDTRRLARARGFAPLTWPVDRNPTWEVSHLGYLVAQEAGRGRDYLALVHRARWEQGRDINSRDTIGEIAAELGLPVRQMADACDDSEVRERGVQCLIRSYHDGLFGVPFFVLGHEKFFGIDRLRPVIALMRGIDLPDGRDQAWLDEPCTLPQSCGLPEFFPAGADAGHVGGCG